MYLEDNELLRICAVIAGDVGQHQFVGTIAVEAELSPGYYYIPLDWFALPVPHMPNFEETFLILSQAITDFVTYFKCLCEIHKRRLKFYRILEHQALPSMEQIVPRCLLEYGLMPSETLASWLVWRKWLYDIDNRSAQETGYLFEPILAAALGGEPYAASTSPIRRADNPHQGRQVDCVDGKLAYEFKMRVTIAASGQGRFKEELGFAHDCHESGYTPMLLVLDPTPSARLDDLIAAYARYGGRAYIGNEAWQHIEDRAGRVMGTFVERYVRTPLREVTASYANPHSLHLTAAATAMTIQVGDQRFSISRVGPRYDAEDETTGDGNE